MLPHIQLEESSAFQVLCNITEENIVAETYISIFWNYETFVSITLGFC